ncbi:hypothetical protein ACFY7C_20725 [Streptomyces sp. NPDC012769]|uniref:hypothetical protein n=1 Tax=Streptomyces sp. NPDC012769 TaxID=3364848 RepID=UPI0036CFDBF6
MGRHKPRKQRRPGKDRKESGLREPTPQGAAHEEWFIPAQGVGPVPLVADEDSEDVRLSTHRPPAVGAEPWAFVGEGNAAAAGTCLPDAMLNGLPLDVVGAVTYLRGCRALLQEPTFGDFAERFRDLTTDEARSLWDAAWASGFVDDKGCEACPSAHLCTRSAEAAGES